MPVDGRQELSNGTEIQPAIGSCVPNCIGFGRCPFLLSSQHGVSRCGDEWGDHRGKR